MVAKLSNGPRIVTKGWGEAARSALRVALLALTLLRAMATRVLP